MSDFSHVKPDGVAVTVSKTKTGEIIHGLTPDEIEEHARLIGGTWHKAAASIIETALMIKEARQKWSANNYRDLKKSLQSGWNMSDSTISKLYTIGCNKILTLPRNIPHLPPSYATLHLLASAPDDELASAIERRDINPELMRKDVSEAVPSLAKKPSTKSIAIPKRTITITGDATKIPQKLIEDLEHILASIDAVKGISVKDK